MIWQSLNRALHYKLNLKSDFFEQYINIYRKDLLILMKKLSYATLKEQKL